jgi:hypothetical protein
MRATHSPKARRWLCGFIGIQSRLRAARTVPLISLVGRFGACVCALPDEATQPLGGIGLDVLRSLGLQAHAAGAERAV